MDLKALSQYTRKDTEKQLLLDEALRNVSYGDVHLMKMAELSDAYVPQKFCPKCNRPYPQYENFCLKCGVSLKDIKKKDIPDLDLKPKFIKRGSNKFSDFESLLSTQNLERIREFDFTYNDFDKIIKKIRITAIRRFNKAIKDNEIYLDSQSVLDKILLFSKSFVNVEYKSQGKELGYYEFNTIYIDDRQLDVLQITTLLHELSHFILKEIITQALCIILDCTKTREIESLATYILTYSSANQLIDEYSAHTVEGRFTLFGYQDYSSYLNLEKSIDAGQDEIEMIKIIGNTFASQIKKILESYIDSEVFGEIKDKFKREIRDEPDYKHLSLEICTLLTGEGFIQALKFIILEGFVSSLNDIETLEAYNQRW